MSCRYAVGNDRCQYESYTQKKEKILSGTGHIRIIPDARPSVNPISLFSGPPGPPPPFFNPLYQTLELGEPARQVGLYLWDAGSVPFIGVDVSPTPSRTYYQLTQGAMVCWRGMDKRAGWRT